MDHVVLVFVVVVVVVQSLEYHRILVAGGVFPLCYYGTFIHYIPIFHPQHPFSLHICCLPPIIFVGRYNIDNRESVLSWCFHQKMGSFCRTASSSPFSILLLTLLLLLFFVIVVFRRHPGTRYPVALMMKLVTISPFHYYPILNPPHLLSITVLAVDHMAKTIKQHTAHFILVSCVAVALLLFLLLFVVDPSFHVCQSSQFSYTTIHIVFWKNGEKEANNNKKNTQKGENSILFKKNHRP
jgi:hypothetical protein